MIIRNDKPSRSSKIPLPGKWLYAALGIIVLIGIGYTLLPGPKVNEDVIYCSAENVEGHQFVENDYTFANASTQSADKARTGNYSVKLDSENRYGMRYVLKNFDENDRYCASVWKWSEHGNNGYLAVQGNEGSNFFVQSNTAVEKDGNNWMKYEVCFSVPSNPALKEIKIFPYYTQGDKGIYFDDLQIFKQKEEDRTATSFTGKLVQLYLNDSGVRKLREKRDKAISMGLLQTEEDDWTEAHFMDSEEKYNVEIRLKGDWTDHLRGDKWSYRVKLKSEEAWNRLQVFSLQSPDTRDLLSEWVYHQMLEQEDVLTPRYDFVRLKVNDGQTHVYAYEEHFTKLLPEYRNRREGPIVKFSEDAVWQQRLRSYRETGNMDTRLMNEIYNSEILPFGEGKILKDTTQLRLFLSAQTLMHQLKYSLKPVDEILDVKRMAKFFAIMDVLGAHHSLVWHNLRFYYNPVTQRLEPIGFDGFTENGSMEIGKLFYGQKSSNIHNQKELEFLMPLYRHREFSEAYAVALSRFTSETYLDSFFNGILPELNARQQFIRQDYPAYNYNIEEIKKKARVIAAAIEPYNDFSLRGFLGQKKDSREALAVTNYHTLPLILEGIGNKEGVTTYLDTLINANHSFLLAEYTKIPYQATDGEYLHYYLPGSNKRFTSRIKYWDLPGPEIGSQSLGEKLILPLGEENYINDGIHVTIKPGKYVLTQPIIIPSGISLTISAGVEMDLRNGSFMLSRGAMHVSGKKESPVRIYSSDGSGKGIFVMQAEASSIWSFVSLDGMTNLSYRDWVLTGALTFYESNVKMNHVSISNNTCEDALNIIRSSFDISYLHLSDTQADGFDADFCSGDIRNAYITRTGNDGLDFSGSVVTILDCAMSQIGDKGLSAGEQATVHIKNTSIEGADIGIASKDLSKVRVENVRLTNCDKGFAVYQKKPEYGPAEINVISFTQENVNHLKMEEEGSKISIESN